MPPISAAAHARRPPTGRTAPRRLRPARIIGLAIAAAALVGGCGTSSSPNAAGPASASTAANATSSETPGSSLDTSLDPCNLLTADQVAKAIGMKVSAGKPRAESMSDSHDCTWSTAYGEGAEYNCAKDVTGVVLVVVGPPPALKERYPTAQSYFADLLTLKRTTGSVQQVSGIGDGAFAATSATKKGLDVYATKGSVILRVFSSCGSPTTLRPELQQLISQALAKT